MSFIWKMAWRDSRRSRSRLLLLVSAIATGVAALTAVRTLSENLKAEVAREARDLLGADLLIQGNFPLPDSLYAQLKDAKEVKIARVFNLLSMAYFPNNGGTRLVNVRAAEPGYPFYGTWKSNPAGVWRDYQHTRHAHALLEHTLFLQFGLKVGDTVRLGNQSFAVVGDLLSRPGRAGIGSALAPTAFIPMAYLDSTGLMQKGSRVWYQYYAQVPDEQVLKNLIKRLERPLQLAGLDWETPESTREALGEILDRFAGFLNLIAFVALLLGAIGVAGAVHLYLKEKRPLVATLRCLGARSTQALMVFCVQIVGIALVSSLTGALMGTLLQKALPVALRDLLPVETLSTRASWSAIGQGVALGVLMATLFSLGPLMEVRTVSPLAALRAQVETSARLSRGKQFGLYVLTVLAIGGLAAQMLQNTEQTAGFLGGMALALGCLWASARLLLYALRRFFPKRWSYVWRQGIANLFRPDNQTTLLVMTIGSGVLLLSTLFLTQSLLLQRIELAGSDQQPNLILFDIQPQQQDAVARFVRDRGLPLLQQVPIVSTRIERIEGKGPQPRRPIARSTTSSWRWGTGPDSIARWVWDREFRVTFRDTLSDSERVIAGTWQGHHTPGQRVRVSISENLQRALHARIGTRITFNVQGRPIEAEVGSVRRLSFDRLQTNFMIVFPTGVLEPAPQTHVIVSRVGNAAQSALFQSELVRRFPNVSAIDLTQILQAADEILKKVSFIVRFMAFFSLLTGFLVLLTSLYQTRYARLRESVLLRTLGAGRGTILRILAVEYALVGILAAAVGAGLSLVSTWALARWVFQMPFYPKMGPLLLTSGAVVISALLLGLWGNRSALQQPPLVVLRRDLG